MGRADRRHSTGAVSATVPVVTLPEEEVRRLQHGFGYTREDLKLVIEPMALEGKDAIWSMGDDTPIAPLARTPRPLYGFFRRQRFARAVATILQSIHIVSPVVISLRTRLGPWPHLLDKHAPLPGLVLPSPFLSLGQMAALRQRTYPLAADLPLASIDCIFAPDSSLKNAIDSVCKRAVDLVRAGTRILLLTDSAASPKSLPIPMAMATGAVHHALVKAGLRTEVGLAVEAGDCRDVHHAAVLIGYGAGAGLSVWLALQTARVLAGRQAKLALLKSHAIRPGESDVEDGNLCAGQLSSGTTVRYSRPRCPGYRPLLRRQPVAIRRLGLRRDRGGGASLSLGG